MGLYGFLFYGGITAMALAVLSGIAAFAAFKIRASKLKRQLDAEYGAQTKEG